MRVQKATAGRDHAEHRAGEDECRRGAEPGVERESDDHADDHATDEHAAQGEEVAGAETGWFVRGIVHAALL